MSAHAATQSQIPNKFAIPWANGAGSAYIRAIPQPSQIGILNCAASLTDGFPPLTFTPSASGGCPPFGQDFNGILNQITLWNRWQAMGGPVLFDSSFSTSIGGYPKGAVIQSSVLFGRRWISTADNNNTNPDDQTGAAANWIAVPGELHAGQLSPEFSTTIPQGRVSANGLTVGNASSNATNRANADTYWLFIYLWTNCSGCQLFNSGGGAIGRGANANADWAANDAIATVNMNGAALMGADSQNGTSSGNLNNVPVVNGSRTVPTSILGENLHSLIIAELAVHNHTDAGHTHSYFYPTLCNCGAVNQANVNASTFGGATAETSGTGFASIQNTGSGTGHNTVPRSAIVYWNHQL